VVEVSSGIMVTDSSARVKRTFRWWIGCKSSSSSSIGTCKVGCQVAYRFIHPQFQICKDLLYAVLHIELSTRISRRLHDTRAGRDSLERKSWSEAAFFSPIGMTSPLGTSPPSRPTRLVHPTLSTRPTHRFPF
jgi:hypothetical protein